MSKEAVDAILARARLPIADEDEYQRLVSNYAVIERQIAELRMPEVRYAEPAVVYPAQ